MDQKVIAGVGNVYRAEVLFRHRLDPWMPGPGARPRGQWDAMWADLVVLMRDGVRRGRIVTTLPAGPPAPVRARAQGRGSTTCTAAPTCRASCAGRRSSPSRWRAGTCSGARSARPAGARLHAGRGPRDADGDDLTPEQAWHSSRQPQPQDSGDRHEGGGGRVTGSGPMLDPSRQRQRRDRGATKEGGAEFADVEGEMGSPGVLARRATPDPPASRGGPRSRVAARRRTSRTTSRSGGVVARG